MFSVFLMCFWIFSCIYFLVVWSLLVFTYIFVSFRSLASVFGGTFVF